MGMDIDPEDKPSYTTQNQDTLLKDVQNEYCTKDTCLPVIKSDSIPTNNLIPTHIAFRSG
jgi:hypothetical protein